MMIPPRSEMKRNVSIEGKFKTVIESINPTQFLYFNTLDRKFYVAIWSEGKGWVLTPKEVKDPTIVVALE